MGQIEDLIELLQKADPSQLRNLAKEMDKVVASPSARRSTNGNGSVKTYTTVRKKYKCLLCNSTFERVQNLTKGEVTHCTDITGNTRNIAVTGKEGEVCISSVVSRCEFCEAAIDRWSYEELKGNFKRLLNNCSFKEIADYSKSE